MKVHFEKNLDTLAIDKSAAEDPAQWKDITSLCSHEMAQFRQGMRTKVSLIVPRPLVHICSHVLQLEVGEKNRDDIYKLTKDILVFDVKAKPAHFTRVAFLVRHHHRGPSRTEHCRLTLTHHCDSVPVLRSTRHSEARRRGFGSSSMTTWRAYGRVTRERSMISPCEGL